MEGMRLDLTIKGPQKNKTKITKEAFILKCLFFLQYILLIKIFFCDNIFDINFIQGVYLMYISNSKDIKKYFSNLRITNKINRKLNSLFSNIIFDNESELLSLSNNFSKNHNISKQDAIIKIFIDCILKSNETIVLIDEVCANNPTCHCTLSLNKIINKNNQNTKHKHLIIYAISVIDSYANNNIVYSLKEEDIKQAIKDFFYLLFESRWERIGDKSKFIDNFCKKDISLSFTKLISSTKNCSFF